MFEMYKPGDKIFFTDINRKGLHEATIEKIGNKWILLKEYTHKINKKTGKFGGDYSSNYFAYYTEQQYVNKTKAEKDWRKLRDFFEQHVKPDFLMLHDVKQIMQILRITD